MLDVTELLVGRLETAISSEGRLVVDLGQVGQLVLLTPQPQRKLAVRGRGKDCFLSR